MMRVLFWSHRHHFLAICVLPVLFSWATANARDLGGVPPVLNPQSYQDCQDLASRWYEKQKALENANRVCMRRDGGTIRASGIWMPNCNARQQAYVSCTSLSDQMCWVDNQQREAVSNCHRDLAANQAAARDRETAAGKLQQDLKDLQKLRDDTTLMISNGPAAVLLQKYAITPARAGENFQDALKEAARTTGTRAPDSRPELNRTGAASDALYRAITPNGAIAEIGSQSAAASRARFGDALNQLDGALNQAALEGMFSNARGISAPNAVRPVPQRSLGRDADDGERARRAEFEERQQAAARFESMRQLSQAIQQATDAVNASRNGGSTYAPSHRGSGAVQAPKCRSSEVVGPNVDRSIPLCKY